MRTIARPKSLTQKVADTLRSSIINGELTLGQSLSEASLSETFGVSKTPVREALFILKQEGLIEIIPQKGSFVFKPTEQSIQELCNFRSYVEPVALEAAMQHAPQAFLEELEICIVKMEHKFRQEDYKSLLVLDDEFHQAFFRHCHNSLLQKSYKLVQYHIGAIRSHLTTSKEAFQEIINDHKTIFQLLSDNQLAEAQQRICTHVLGIKAVKLVSD